MKMIDLIEQYQLLDSLMEQMFKAAKTNDWDAVFDIEIQYLAQFEILKAIEIASKGQVLSFRQQVQKNAIIEHILSLEESVKAIVSPTMAALSKQIKGVQTQVKLNNSYASNQYVN